MLFGVGVLDPLIYASIFGLVTAISLFSPYVPARRAARLWLMAVLCAE